MLEKHIQQRIMKLAKSEFDALIFKSSGESHRGVPDLTCCLPSGLTVFMEVKTATGKLSPLQEHFIEQLKQLNQHVYVVRSVEEARAALLDAQYNTKKPQVK